MGARTKRPTKKPRKRVGAKPPHPQQVARVLLDAETFTDTLAARRAGLSTKTVQRWRNQFGADPEVSRIVQLLRERLATGWTDKVRAARNVAVDSVLEKLIDPESTLRDRTVALRELRETAHAYELLNADTPGNHQRGGAATPGGAGAAGEGSAEG